MEMSKLQQLRERNRQLREVTQELEPEEEAEDFAPSKAITALMSQLRGSSDSPTVPKAVPPVLRSTGQPVPMVDPVKPMSLEQAKQRARRNGAQKAPRSAKPVPAPEGGPSMQKRCYDVLWALSGASTGSLDYIGIASRVFGLDKGNIPGEVDVKTGTGYQGSIRAIRNAARPLVRWGLVERVPPHKEMGPGGKAIVIPAGLRITDKGVDLLSKSKSA